MKIVSVIFLLLLSITLLMSCAKPEQPLTINEIIDLGEKYLLELDYEQALVQFLNVIEVEPMNPRGYTGAADAYMGLGQLINAIAILNDGLRVIPTNSNLKLAIERIDPTLIIASSPLPITTSADTDFDEAKKTLQIEELVINGMVLGNATIYDFSYDFDFEVSTDSHWLVHEFRIGTNTGNQHAVPCMSIFSPPERNTFDLWIFQAKGMNHVGYFETVRNGVVGPRGIVIGKTSIEEALELLNESSDSEHFYSTLIDKRLEYNYSDSNGDSIFFKISFMDELVYSFKYEEDVFFSFAIEYNPYYP